MAGWLSCPPTKSEETRSSKLERLAEKTRGSVETMPMTVAGVWDGRPRANSAPGDSRLCHRCTVAKTERMSRPSVGGRRMRKNRAAEAKVPMSHTLDGQGVKCPSKMPMMPQARSG